MDGIWASAPYFHNDCAPNLEVALDSSKRPKFWRRSFDPKDYDVQAPGWKFESLSEGKRGDIFRDRYIYDTSVNGYGCSGHT